MARSPCSEDPTRRRGSSKKTIASRPRRSASVSSTASWSRVLQVPRGRLVADRADRYLTNANLTFWQVDERKDAGIESAKGVAFSANALFGKRFMPCLHLGWSEGLAPIYNRSATLGFIYAFTRRSDLAGIAVNWGDPPDESLREQITVEAFHRLQVAQDLLLATGGLTIFVLNLPARRLLYPRFETRGKRLAR